MTLVAHFNQVLFIVHYISDGLDPQLQYISVSLDLCKLKTAYT